MDTLTNILNIAGSIIISIGGAGAIIFGLSSWLGKVWANRLMEQEKANYSKELEKLKSEFTQNTERYKLQLKKSELFFQKQYEAATDFGKFFYSLLPDKTYVNMDWDDACKVITYDFQTYMSYLKKFQLENNILFDETINSDLRTCQLAIQNYHDDKDIHDANDYGEAAWNAKAWDYGDKFYSQVEATYKNIKSYVVKQVEY